jgi:hypothetical protein
MKKPTSGHSGGGLSMMNVSCLRRQSRPLAASVMDVQQQHMHFRLGVLIAETMIEREEGEVKSIKLNHWSLVAGR